MTPMSGGRGLGVWPLALRVRSIRWARAPSPTIPLARLCDVRSTEAVWQAHVRTGRDV